MSRSRRKKPHYPKTAEEGEQKRRRFNRWADKREKLAQPSEPVSSNIPVLQRPTISVGRPDGIVNLKLLAQEAIITGKRTGNGRKRRNMLAGNNSNKEVGDVQNNLN